MSGGATTTDATPANVVSHLPRVGRRVTVVEASGFRLRAAVVVTKGRRAAIERVATSRNADPEAALAEALGALRAGGPVSKQAVLISSQVTPALLELPVTPSNPRPAAQMEELVRWELEPQLAQQAGVRPLGAILVARGHLAPAQARAIGAEVEERRRQGRRGGPPTSGARAASASGIRAASASGIRAASASQAGGARGGSAVRFGDVAIELGLTGRDEIDEARRLQRWFADPDDEVVCGFAAQGELPDEPGRGRWLAAAIGRRARQAWIDAFAANGLVLRGIYPTVGTGAATLNGELAGGRRASVLDVQGDLVGCARVAEVGVTDLRLVPHPDGEPSLDRCLELIAGREDDILYLATGSADAELLRKQLAAVLGEAPPSLPVTTSDADRADAASLAGIAAAGAHAIGVAPGARAVCIPAREAGPGASQRPVLWWAAALVAIAALVFAGERWRAGRLDAAMSASAAAQERLQAVQRETARVRGIETRVEALQGELEAEGAWLATADARRRLLEETLQARERRLGVVLDALRELASPTLAIDRCEETRRGELVISAFTLTQRDAEELARALLERLAPEGLRLAGQSVTRSGAGRLGLAGFALELRLTESDAATPTADDDRDEDAR